MTLAYQGPVRLVVFDVDGVLTDGALHLGAEGEMFKSFSARDGVAFGLLRAHGILSAIISGKASRALDYRVTELSIDHAVTGCSNKAQAYASLKALLGLEDRHVVFVGDDVIDLAVMKQAGSSYAPADAHPLARRVARHVTRAAGGKGVAREVVEHVLLLGGVELDEAYLPMLVSEGSCHVRQ
ncbi:MAG: HAD hydrolase family protein [Pseudomonas sp.]|nr:HAD hydrolase family protein [Pseudomonas sp.]